MGCDNEVHVAALVDEEDLPELMKELEGKVV